METVTDDRAADDNTRARGKSLQRAEKPQRLDVAGDRAAERGQRVDAKAAQDDRPTAERVGQRAMPEHHEGEREQVGGQRLLERDGRSAEFAPDCGKRGQVHIDGKRSQHRQRRKKRGEPP